jgi:hypothetical protein
MINNTLFSKLFRKNNFLKKYNEHILLVVSGILFISFFYHCSKKNIYENLDVCPNCSSLSNSSDCNQCNNCGWCENNGTGVCTSGTTGGPTTQPVYYGDSLGNHETDDPIDYNADIPYIAAPDSCDAWTGPTGAGAGSVSGSIESSVVGSIESSVVGSIESSVVGSMESSVVGSIESSVAGSIESSVAGSIESSVAGSIESSVAGSIDSSIDISALFDGSTCVQSSAGVDSSIDTSVSQATSCPVQTASAQSIQNNNYPLQDLNINIINASDLGND